MKHLLAIVILLSITLPAKPQTPKSEFWTAETTNSTPITKPNILSNHPLGIYTSRLFHNFNSTAAKQISFSFEYSSGNTMLPYVKSYELTDPSDRASSKSIPWHTREFAFDFDNIPSKVKEFEADGVIRSYRLTFSLPLNKQHEINFNVRAYSLDGGKYPYSIFTADESIEWFHSNIAGGEDPFSRYHYGINQANIRYKDEDNKIIEMNNGDFKIGGFEVNYNYYPELELNDSHHIYLNLGAQLGINTSKYNSVSDFGISSSLIKKIMVLQKNCLDLGVSLGAFRQHFMQYGNRVNFSNKNYLYSFEGLINYRINLQNKHSLSYGINYTFQTAYNKKNDLDYIAFTGERINTHWQKTLYHLYEDLEGWNFIFTYTAKRFSYFIYLREDLNLDNAPDLQTGIGLKMVLEKSKNKNL